MARYSGSAAEGGAAAVNTVNGIAPVAGDVTLGATDIPYSPTFATLATTGNTATTVGGQLLFGETRTGTMSWIWGEPTLEAAFPVAANTHTVDRPAFMLTPLGGAPIVAQAGNDVEVAHPGSIDSSGVQKVLLTGDVAGPLIKGEVVASGFGLLNTSIDPAAKDMQVDSLAGRLITQVDMTTLGDGGVEIENVFGGANFRVMIQAPASSGASGVTLGGTLGAVLMTDGLAQAPPGGGYVAIDVLSTAVVASQFVVSGYGSVTLDATDVFTRLDPAATLPGGPPLPTSGIGTQYFHVTNQGLGTMFDATGIGAGDIRVFSSSHQSGPRSNWIGDAIYNSAGPDPDALLDHIGQANVPLIVPFDNSQNGGAGGTLETLTITAANARHSLMLGTVDAASVNAGGTYTGDGNFPATQASTSGSGSGAEFTVTVTGGTVTAVVSIDKLGSGYAATDTITLLVAGPTETVAALLNADGIAWALQTDGPVGDLTGPARWTVDHQRGGGGAGSTVFGYLARRAAGSGPWVEVPGTRSIPQALLTTPQEAGRRAILDDIRDSDQWTIFWVNDNGNSTQTLFTIIEPLIEGQP